MCVIAASWWVCIAGCRGVAGSRSPDESSHRTPAISAAAATDNTHVSSPPAPQDPALVPPGPPPPLTRCFPDDGPLAPSRPLAVALERATLRLSEHDYAGALACAEHAARVEPRSAQAHYARVVALVELGQIIQARSALTRALALDPDDPEILAGAADFYLSDSGAAATGNDYSEAALAYARRGLRRLKRAGSDSRAQTQERAVFGRLELAAGQALNDLGRANEALRHLDIAVAAMPGDVRGRYERGVALFELCRFAEAVRQFDETLAQKPNDAWAHHHLGLTLEQLGDSRRAEAELERARALSPGDFPPPVLLPADEFRKLVDNETAQLPPQLKDDLRSVRLEIADLPDIADLTAEEPPLSPTILGLYRGTPLGEPSGDSGSQTARTIVLYRKNLGRAVANRSELATQVRTTLLHELGHLRGEDDAELRSRGLE